MQGGVSYDQVGRRKLSYLFRETSDKLRAKLSSAVVRGIWEQSQCLSRTETGEKGGTGGAGATDLNKGTAADEKSAKGGKASRI